MKLYFLRHGQTEFNKEGKTQGQEIDLPLNDIGIKQVENLIEFLPKEVDLIISSPLKRAYQTAQIINQRFNKRIEINDAVKEARLGNLAGKTWAEIEVETKKDAVYGGNKDIEFDFRLYGGENAEDLKNRVAGFVAELKNNHKDEVILVTTHGGVIDAMHTLFPQKERRELDNATIHEFTF